MTPLAQCLIEDHISAPRGLGIAWYESVGALIMLAILAERRGITDTEFTTLAQQIRAGRDNP